MNIEKLVKINTYLVSGLIYVLVFPHISVIYKLSFLFLFIVTLYRDFFRDLYIPRIFLNIAAVILIVFMAVRTNINDIVTPVLETLLLLLSLKLLEYKKFRDYMQIYLLITLIFAGYSILSISMVFLIYLILFIFLLNFSIILLTYYNEDNRVQLTKKQLQTIITKSVVIPVLSIPLTALLFLFLPRTNYPLLNIMPGQSKGKTGFSDNVSLGEVSSIQENNQTVFRVSMEKIGGEVYFRGITFNMFDGKSWKNTIPENIKSKKTFPPAKTVSYTVYLEPTYDTYLFTVDVPYRVDLGQNRLNYYPYFHRDLTVTTSLPITQKIKYDGVSILTDRYEDDTPVGYFLLLPPDLSKNVLNYAKKFKDSDDYKTADNIVKELFKLEYSLADLPTGENQLEKFLFVKKRGNCEYFATAMAVMLRINNIPSRVVGGYKTSTYNDVGKYYLVKEKDAHLWVEAYINGKWVRFDPTPPIRTQVIQTIERPSKLKLLYDTINYYYNVFILNYDFSKQMALYKTVGSKISSIRKIDIDKQKITIYLIYIVVILTVVSVLALIYRYMTESYEKRLVRLLIKQLKKAGVEKRDNEGFEESVMKIEDLYQRDRFLKVVRDVESYIYGKRKMDKVEFEKLKKELSGII
ncbi:MAG: DUF3488 and transglutaminase-like domain-containing protein [Hydrogenothermaceae bacterium]|nr:DUF3488 and transglutaminase-like domain-containing protein [Hydrogenothermaceae bacterium]